MKARASFYAPETPPDTAGLLDIYGRLVLMISVLTSIRDFSGVLKTSGKLRRAAKALMAGRARAAAIETKWKMLLCPDWRARVISDLGGRRKLALWDAAMKRAIARERDSETLYPLLGKPPSPEPSAQIETPQSYAARLAEIARREHSRKCARACANPQILKDPFRVDQDGLFRLAPVPRGQSDVPRAPASGHKSVNAQYTYDPRRLTNLTGYFAPATLWPVEIYAAERMEAARTDRAPAMAFGPSPGAKRRPHHSKISRRHFDAKRHRCKTRKPPRAPLRFPVRAPRHAPRRKPVFAPP